MSWEKCVTRDLQALGQPTNMHDLKNACALLGPGALAEHVVKSDTPPCCGSALPVATQCHMVCLWGNA